MPILHFDLDCFFAAVEMIKEPALSSVPMAVGGSPNKRGVIATANYPARKFGVRSGMSSAQALKLCPQLTLRSGQMSLYREYSEKVMNVLKRVDGTLEICSLDEAYIDISGLTDSMEEASEVANGVRQTIYQETKLTCSAGIAPNRFLAKVCSDWRKPNGQFTLPQQSVENFIKDLPVEKIPGVGPVSLKKLHAHNIKTCLDLQLFGLYALERTFYSFGRVLFERAFGRDDTPIGLRSERKSISCENTFPRDLESTDQVLNELILLQETLQRRLEKFLERKKTLQDTEGHLFLKMKFFDFSIRVISSPLTFKLKELLNHLKQENSTAYQVYKNLAIELFEKDNKPIRNLGIGIKLKKNEVPDALQLELFPWMS